MYYIIVKLLTEHHLEFLSLKGGCIQAHLSLHMSKCHIFGNLALAQKLQEKDLVHKLFKVLAPRYSKYTTSFSRIYKLPRTYPGLGMDRSILELKGNFLNNFNKYQKSK